MAGGSRTRGTKTYKRPVFATLSLMAGATLCLAAPLPAMADRSAGQPSITTATLSYAVDQISAVEAAVTVPTGSPTDISARTDDDGKVTYGPFHYRGTVDSVDMIGSVDSVDMIGTVDSATPAAFARMLAAHPGIRRIRMIECPGSDDEDANLQLAGMVRAAGIATFVPAGGSVRSGAVELFLAGTQRHAEPGAEFAVHSWQDEDGREASDFAADDPVHRPYLDFYRSVGMTEAKARAFYRLTNSAPFDDALYLEPRDLSQYVALN